MRSLLAATLVCALASCGVSSGAPGPGAATTGCAPAGGRPLAASSEARIYSARGSVYGCTSGHRRRLGSATLCIASDRVGPVALSGGLAAYAVTSCGVDSGSTEVIVLRLSTGHRLSSDQASSLSLGPESFDPVGSIVVNRRGQVAWIVSASSIGTHLRGVQVVAHEKGGRRVLDSGRTIAAGSLRLLGSKLTWKRGGAVQAAPLR